MEFLDYTVPKIILQPIVENSIYHGIKPMEGLGRILVTAQEEGEYLIFMVEDNGAGFNPASPKDGRCVRKGAWGLKKCGGTPEAFIMGRTAAYRLFPLRARAVR